jgi:hypothetical protein
MPLVSEEPPLARGAGVPAGCDIPGSIGTDRVGVLYPPVASKVFDGIGALGMAGLIHGVPVEAGAMLGTEVGGL